MAANRGRVAPRSPRLAAAAPPLAARQVTSLASGGAAVGLAFRALGLAIAYSYRRIFWTLLWSLLAALLSVPLIAAALGVCLLAGQVRFAALIVPLFVQVLPNPALGGVQTFAWNTVRGDDTNLREYWQGVQQWWRPALRAWLPAAVVTILLLGNLAFYVQQARHAVVWQGLILFFLILLFLWIGLHLFVYPLLLAQEEVGVQTTYRNAAVLLLAHPLFVVTVVPFWCLFLLVTNFTGLVLALGLAISAMLQQTAGALVIQQFQKQQE